MRTLDLRDSSRRLTELPSRTPVLLFVDGVNYAPDEDLTGMFPIDADEIESFRDRTVLAADGGSFLWVHRALHGEFHASHVHRHVGPSRETTTIASGECTAQDDVSLAADAHLGVTVIAEQHTYRTTKYVAPPDWAFFQEALLRLTVMGADGTRSRHIDLPFTDLARLEEGTSSMQISPDATRAALVAAVRDPVTPNFFLGVAVLDLATGEITARLHGRWLADGRTWSPDGHRLLVTDKGMPAIHDLRTGATTPLEAPFGEQHLHTRRNHHRIQGWAGDEHLVTIFQRGRSLTLNLVHLASGEVTPLMKFGRGQDWFASIASLSPDEWLALAHDPA